MKTKILSFLFLLYSIFILAQKKEEYFQKIIDTTKNEALKLNSLDSLTFNQQKVKDYLKYATWSESYIDLAIKLKKYEEAAKKANNAFYNINVVLGDTDRAFALYKKLEEHINKIDNQRVIGTMFLKKGGGYFNLNKLDDAKNSYKKAISYFGETRRDSLSIADSYFFIGQVEFEKRNFIASISQYKIASSYYEKLKDTDYLFKTWGSIITIYGAAGFIDKTIKERTEFINKKVSLNHLSGIEVDYYNLAGNYQKKGNYNKQEEFLLLSAKHLEKATSFKNYKSILINGALCEYYLDKNFSKASKYFITAKENAKGKQKNGYEETAFNMIKAKYLFKTKKYFEAQKLAEQTLTLEKNNKNTDHVKDLYNLLYKIHDKQKQYKNSLKYYKDYSSLKDSLQDITKLNALSYYQTLYETEQKEKEIDTQKAALSILAKENEAKKRLLISGGIAAALLFFIFYLYRNKQLAIKKAKMREEYSHNLLLSQEEERKRISKDLHDSLGQSLLLIKNKVSLKSDDKTKELVNNAIEEMRTISRVLHPFQLEDIGISRALENLINQLDESYEKTYIFGNIDDISNKLNQDQEVNVFRIIQECLSNIIKHAKADSAKVTLINNSTQILISIKDNGIGFDFSERYNDFRSLGLKTIKERVRFLKGTLKIDSEKGEGTTFNIQFPIK